MSTELIFLGQKRRSLLVNVLHCRVNEEYDINAKKADFIWKFYILIFWTSTKLCAFQVND